MVIFRELVLKQQQINQIRKNYTIVRNAVLIAKTGSATEYGHLTNLSFQNKTVHNNYFNMIILASPEDKYRFGLAV